jgi:RHH-type proline utilization regulon transcriptional repressor/proline dehydrogenase/delta 1-pyrroline-5-carboxylate dehydrogenase
MADPDFRTDLFRFVDEMPALRTPDQIASHLAEYLLPHADRLPGLLSVGLRAAAAALKSAPASHLAGRAVRARVEAMAERFLVGEDPATARSRLRELWDQGFAFTIDLLGEATLSDAEAARYQARYLDVLGSLPRAVAAWPAGGLLDSTHLGPLPRANVSLKVSALDGRLDAADPAGGVARVRARALPLALAARREGAALHLDMEDWELHGITLDLFEELAFHPELRDWPHLGVTVQAYLRASRDDVERLLSLAARRATPFAVRLVKGAYWDQEVTRARQQGTPCPVFTDKAATDARYEELSELLLRGGDRILPAFAGHNLRSLVHAAVVAEELGRPSRSLEFQTLFGMAEPERRALLSLGHRVRVYAPAGELLAGMAYLVRRLLENTSNTSFLRLGHREKVDPHVLLARPEPGPEARPAAPPEEFPNDEFRNCPLADFTDPSVRTAFAQAVGEAQRLLPLAVPVVVSGRARPATTETTGLERPCPSHTDRLAVHLALATREDADLAVAAAQAAWPAWRDRPLAERARLLEELGSRLEADRTRLSALQVWEEGKPWREADADVAEAVDYCRYYARQALRELAPRELGAVPGERNLLWHEGRGVAVVIAPWNFPLAILCGMASAALVAGNTVILKPAEQSSAVGHAFFEHLRAAGFPAEVVHLLPGLGEEVGAYLVEHPGVSQLAFTGSRAVGLSLVQAAAVTRPGQRQVKRVVCEMGGKNAIVVDDDADLDDAVAGVMKSAFGYAGQKCSACSRVIAVGGAYEPLVARLVEACRSLPLGPAEEPAIGRGLGPVIDAEAFERLRGIIAEPGPGATLLFLGNGPPGGYYVPPALFEVRDPDHRLMQEELFGPVLALLRVASFAEALDAANATPYALTGAVYSRTPSHLRKAEQGFRVGNLYLNRTCTGALVGRQPFGGFGMSGLGTKAGGPGYLVNFADPRCSTENTVRRGFVPDTDREVARSR